MRFHECVKRVSLFAAALLVLAGCKENVDTSARYVFKEETIMSYLKKHEAYSEYVKLLNIVNVSGLSESTVGQLMAARGNYTCFAPTNDAIQAYLEELVEKEIIPEPSWEAFTDSFRLDSIRKVIVYNSIIDGGDEVYYETATFPVTDNAEIAISNLNGRKLTVHYIENQPDSIYINQDCPINTNNRDIPAINGVIHQMEKVVAPSIITLGALIKTMIDDQQGPYLVMGKCIRACDYLDTLSAVRDEVYEKLYLTGKLEFRKNVDARGLRSTEDNHAYLPEHRKYGFTIFAEPDSWWEEQLGKPAKEITPEDVQQWVVEQGYYHEALNNDKYEDESNVLNQWVSYHIVPYRMPADRLVFHYGERGYSLSNPTIYTIPVEEYYCTMGPRRLLRIYESKESNGVYLNRFPRLSNGRTENGHEAYCLPTRVGSRVDKEDPNLLDYSMENGLIYSIDAPLAYSDSVRIWMGRERLRFEGMSFFPEAMNNDIRRMPLTAPKYQNVLFPDDSEYRYLENLRINEGTTFVYYNAYRKGWGDYQGDEIKAVGRYELTFKLPPVPRRGTYEVRYRVLATTARGVAQLYFGEDPDNLPVTGIPIDLTICGKYDVCGSKWLLTGYEDDTDDQDYNAEVDKRMRNNGFMKGELGIQNTNGTGCRTSGYAHIVRRLVTRQTLDPGKTYYLKIKSVLDNDKSEFYMDTIELCPKEVYDNPEEPEDIW